MHGVATVPGREPIRSSQIGDRRHLGIFPASHALHETLGSTSSLFLKICVGWMRVQAVANLIVARRLMGLCVRYFCKTRVLLQYKSGQLECFIFPSDYT